MTRRLILLTFVLFLVSSVYGEPQWHLKGPDDGWKDEVLALQYFHNSELQRQWVWHLMGSHAFNGYERVLDFGCGDGKITAELSHFVSGGEIHGVDLSASMIELATRCFPSKFFPNLTFGQDLTEHQYDLITSFSVFHIVADPIEVLARLKGSLRENGRLLLVIPAGNNPAFFQASKETFEKYGLMAPWRGKSSSGVTMRTVEGCEECLREAGFEPLSVTAFHTPTAFFNKQELVEWMVGTVTANWSIPLEKADTFFHDVIDRMAELDPDVVDASGAYNMKLSRIEVVAR
ncbi:MAG: Trans-aconitate 2-methyltransferase [Chlamydiales bacterium]|nr:Trans-aconitate 2-methyltransferase [Chlamydiales bacterium]